MKTFPSTFITFLIKKGKLEQMLNAKYSIVSESRNQNKLSVEKKHDIRYPATTGYQIRPFQNRIIL